MLSSSRMVLSSCFYVLCARGAALFFLGPITTSSANTWLGATTMSQTWIQRQRVAVSPRIRRKVQSNAILGVRHYQLLSPQEIKAELENWTVDFPDFVQVTTSQAKYGLPTAGDTFDCPYENGAGCLNYIATIQDYVAHPVGSNSSNRLPEVLWSGALHGNERVGPTAVIEAGSLLLAAANCEAQASQSDSFRTCRGALLQQNGIDDAHRRWLARLVATRRIVIVPTANALGYYHNVRRELDIDPNRDFPYDVLNSSCMQSIAARTLNEVYLEHMFQLSLTFHGGTEVVAFEWGAPSWLGFLSPDDTAQAAIATGYSAYSGGFPDASPYEVGTINDLVYYVRGGMEDWAYAGSWDPTNVITCMPDTFGGYDPTKTEYNNSTLRAFNILVETSYDKEPSNDTLGTSFDILTAVGSNSSGHVARNIRLALLSAELVEPYVSIVGINADLVVDETTASRANARACLSSTQAFVVSNTNDQVFVHWTVGGAFDINETKLYFASVSDSLLSVMDCSSQPSDEVLAYFQVGVVLGDVNGTGYFSSNGPNPRPSSNAVLGPAFRGTVDLTQSNSGMIVVLASAQVDQSWSTEPQDIAPELPPQSHMANVRTNPSWHHESAGKVIQGRLEWFSKPLIIERKVDFSGSAPPATSTTISPSLRQSIGFTSQPSNSGSTSSTYLPSIGSTTSLPTKAETTPTTLNPTTSQPSTLWTPNSTVVPTKTGTRPSPISDSTSSSHAQKVTFFSGLVSAFAFYVLFPLVVNSF